MANKYGAKKVEIDGVMFDSLAEGRRYQDLKRLQAQKIIISLELQPVYVLAEGVKLHGEARKRPAIRYRADFRYTTHMGELVVEDVKGMDTPLGRLKRHLMRTVHGVDVRVVR